jgi:hypothetical protein
MQMFARSSASDRFFRNIEVKEEDGALPSRSR